MSGMIDYANGVWAVSDLPPHVSIRFTDVFKGVPFGSRPPFHLKDSHDRAFDLQWFMSRFPLALTDRAQARLDAGVASYLEHQAQVSALLDTSYQPGARDGIKQPEVVDPHQLRAAELFRTTGRLLLLDDVGLGKTVSALASIADGWGLPAAVIVQPHVSEQWLRGFIRRFTHLRAMEVTHRNAKLLAPHDIYVFRYTNIAAWVDYVEALGIKTVIFDEIQELRHGEKTDKGRAARVFCDVAENRLGLTATPIYNYGEEIFNVVDLIAPGALGSWHEFVINWCTYRGTHLVVNDPAALGSYLQTEGIALRRTEDDPEVGRALAPLNKMVVEVGWNEGDALTDLELQKTLALRVLRGRFVERGQAARELDLLLRRCERIAIAETLQGY